MTHTSEHHSFIKVLLIEDNPGDARLVGEFLEEARPGGFCLTNVDRISKAKEALATVDFNVVLLDLTLPDSNGIETYRKVAALTGNMRIVVLTGLEDMAARINSCTKVPSLTSGNERCMGSFSPGFFGQPLGRASRPASSPVARRAARKRRS